MGKPAFDPSQPFEVVPSKPSVDDSSSNAQKPAFDPSQPFQISSDGTPPNERPWYSVDPKNLVPGFFKGLQNVAQTYDEYTGAPIRKFVTEAVMGKDLEKAPTGAEQAKMLGASDTSYKESWGVPSYLGGDVSPADIYGFGLEMVQDPFVIASGVKTAYNAAKPVVKSIANTASSAINAGSKNAAKNIAKEATEETMTTAFKFKAPESLDELRKWKPSYDAGQMPGKQRLEQIVQTVPDIETKPLKYHFDMMDNPKSMKELKLRFENLPTADAKKIAQYNKQIVDESTSKIKSTVSSYVGNDPRSLPDAGSEFIGAVKDKYHSEKDILGPLFEEVQKRAPVLNKTDSHDLIVALGENSHIGKLLDQSSETGRFYLKPNAPRTGLSDTEHKVLSRVIDDLNDGMSFSEIQKTREFLRKAIDPTNPAASAEIGKVRSVMLGQLEDMAQKIDPEIGKTFKAYAINEKSRESIEKIIGGRVETFDAMYAANPEKVVQKVFSNPNHSKIVSEYIGQDKMREMVGSYIQNGIDKATDSARGFSPEKFKSWLKRNENFLNSNVPSATKDRLFALSDYGYYGKRFLDEVNPSGTAASLQAMIEPTEFLQRVKTKGLVDATVGEVANKLHDAKKSFSAKSELDKLLKPNEMKQKTRLMSLDDAGKIAKAATLPKIALREEKQKGSEKWASNGFDRLQSFADSQNDLELSYVLNQLDKNDKQVKTLLISASDFKPGTKGFNKVVEQLRAFKKRKK